MKILGKAQDASFWVREVAEKDFFEKYRKELFDYWDKHDLGHAEFKALKYSQYKLYWETGNREIFEGEYFARRSAIEYTLPLALMYPENKLYIEKIMDWVFNICDEYTWCLPAHQGKLEENNNTKIDLFASETGFHLSLVYALLGDRLDPLIKNRILYEVDRRIVKPFLATDNYGGWERGNSNGTAVCTCSVSGALMILFPELVDDSLIERFNRSIDCYLGGFKDDGICFEGSGYWAYGFGFFVQYADMIRAFTNGRVDYFKLPKVKVVATFPQKMFLSENAAVSFADCGRILNYTIGVMHRLKSEYPDDVLVYDPKYGTYGIDCGRACYRIFGAAWTKEEFWKNPDDKPTFEIYAQDSQWYINRKDGYGFAAKAGNNNELHNHNDIGSFIYAKSGRQMLCDLGSGEYTRQYFSPERYAIIECGSWGHSVPLIDGKEQPKGHLSAAKDAEWQKGCFSFDMAGAYGVPELKSLRRSFVCSESGVELTDVYDYIGDGELVERLISIVKPRLLSEGVLEVDQAQLCFDPSICTLNITETCGTSVRTKQVFLIDFKLNPGVRRFTCKIS